MFLSLLPTSSVCLSCFPFDSFSAFVFISFRLSSFSHFSSIVVFSSHVLLIPSPSKRDQISTNFNSHRVPRERRRGQEVVGVLGGFRAAGRLRVLRRRRRRLHSVLLRPQMRAARLASGSRNSQRIHGRLPQSDQVSSSELIWM